MDFSHHIFNSGLTVIAVPMDSLKSVTVLALCNTGSRYESQGKFGIAHFFEHIVFKGTDKFPTAMDLAEAADSIGANFNAFTSKEYTGYYVQASSDHFNFALDAVSDMLLKPKLRQEDIDREKGVIIEELNLYVDMPSRHIADLFDRMAYQGTGLGHDIIGTKDDILSITTKDFQDFLAQWYGLDNIVLVVAGDSQVIKEESSLNLIKKYFEGKEVDFPRLSLPKDQRIKPWLKKNIISSGQKLLESKKTEQTHFILGWPGIKRSSEQRYALNLLSIVMGGNMSSRLFTELREKRGLGYYVSSDVDQYHDGGMFGVSAGVDPNRSGEAIEVARQEFENLASGKNPVSKKELDRAKSYVSGKMALSLESSQSVAQYFGTKQLLMNKIETPQQVLEKLEKVSVDEVNELARQLINPGEMRIAMIGNQKEKILIK